MNRSEHFSAGAGLTLFRGMRVRVPSPASAYRTPDEWHAAITREVLGHDDGVGRHWSSSRRVAEGFAGGHDPVIYESKRAVSLPVVLEAQVPRHDVASLEEQGDLGGLFAGEQEHTLVRGASPALRRLSFRVPAAHVGVSTAGDRLHSPSEWHHRG